jgi:hypothetical protein
MIDSVQGIQNAAAVEDVSPNSGVSWLFAGVVLPCFDAGFYLHAARRKARAVIWFFIAFGVVLAILSTLGLARGLLQVQDQIRAGYEKGTIPAVTIHNGIATVKGAQPAILFSGRDTVVIVDTTGKINTLDPNRYHNGFLLTRTYLQVVSQNKGSQIVPLSEINRGMEVDPIVLDSDSVTQMWGAFARLLGILGFLGLIIWDTLVRLGYLALLALVVWGITRLAQPRAAYTPVFIIGAYAFVPALYLSYLLGLVKVYIFALQTLIWVAIWITALILAYRKSRLGEAAVETGFWTWKAWVGMAPVALFAANVVFAWPFGPQLLWVATIIWLLALITSELLRTLKPEEIAD